MQIHQKIRLLCFTAPFVLAACATNTSVTALPDRLELGRDASFEPCQANRSFSSPALKGETDVAYTINCRGSSASRSFGTVSAVRLAAEQSTSLQTCGEAATVELEGVGPVQARRCFDQELGLPTVEISLQREGRLYRGSAVQSVLGPMERAFRTLTGASAPNSEANRVAPASIQVEQLASAGQVDVSSSRVSARSDAEIILREGLLRNRRGLYVEASGLLNDALSRLPEDTPPGVRAEIALEAGLADSNIKVPEAAAVHFAEADRILKDNANIDRASFLQQKRSIYRALDALNRRDWSGALAALATSSSATPLEDPAVLAEINQTAGGREDTSSAVSGPRREQLDQLVIDAQRSWAASVAHLAQRQPNSVASSEKELQSAVRNIGILLGSNIDPSSLIWLTAQIERQAGRLAARSAGSTETSGYEAALTHFDCALAALQARMPRNENACAIPLAPEARARLRRGAQGFSGPVIAETQIEQASFLARAGRSPTEVAAKYDEAVDALISANHNGVTVPAGLEAYLSILSQQQQGDANNAERFFKALQVVGEPATARQFSQLQQIVTADGATGAKIRDRSELERSISALRYAIAETADPSRRAALEAERAEKERQKEELNAELESTRFSTTTDRPATVAEVQTALSPGEVYWKLADVRGQLFAIAISNNQSTIYQVAEPSDTVRALARKVRRSISDGSDTIPFFDVPSSAALFQILAGPAERQIRSAKAVVVDPAGPLNDLPAGVLVTDLATVKSYLRTRKAAPNNYSMVSFLAAQADLQTALSPRSFLISRTLVASTAPKPFIGFGEHSITPLPRLASAEPIRIGSGCPIGYQELARVVAEQKPISAEKISVAAAALGVPNAPQVTGAAFTDEAVKNMDGIDQYQVLHFATHGNPETRMGCVSLPPSLLTTLGGQGSDGFLSFDEIARMRLNANLVVLSACETSAGVSSGLARRGYGQDEGGQAALSGLVRAFLAANSRAVLATYWKVSTEEESDALFSTFYSKGRTGTIRGALKEAQSSLIRNPSYSHPFYWGAYFVVGDANKPMLTRS